MKDPIFDYRITDYDRSILPSRFLAFMDTGVSGPADWIPRTGRSLGHPGWGLIYHMVLSVMRPDEFNYMIETGTNVGSTAMIIAQALLDSGRPGLLRTIEIDEEIAEEAKRRLELAGVDQVVEVYVGDSLEKLKDLADFDTPIRVAFLDGNHFHDHVVTEFDLVFPYLTHDSLVVFDNTYLIAEGEEDPRVNGALRTIVNRYGGSLINLPVSSWYTPGIAIWQMRPFDDMTPPDPKAFTPDS